MVCGMSLTKYYHVFCIKQVEINILRSMQIANNTKEINSNNINSYKIIAISLHNCHIN